MTIQTATNSPAAIRAEMVATLERAKFEAESLFHIRGKAHVVCYAADLTPFRSNGKEIRIAVQGGGMIWNSFDKLEAMSLASDLNKQAKQNGAGEVVSMSVREWHAKRIETLDSLIASITAL